MMCSGVCLFDALRRALVSPVRVLAPTDNIDHRGHFTVCRRPIASAGLDDDQAGAAPAGWLLPPYPSRYQGKLCVQRLENRLAARPPEVLARVRLGIEKE